MLFLVQSGLIFIYVQVLLRTKSPGASGPAYPPVAFPSRGFSEPFLPVGPPCSCDVVLIKALLSCCDSSDIVY